jgi:uncharacterized protein (TIRG00374 family)
MKKGLTVALMVLLSVLILFFLFRNMDAGAFWKAARSVDLSLLVVALLIYVGTQLASTLRWSMILREDFSTLERVRYPRLLSIYYMGMFFNNFLPTMVGGDVVKGYYLYRLTKRGDVAISSIFMDRYSGFSALMLITAVALIPGYALIRETTLPALLLLLIGAFVFLSLVIWVAALHSWAISMLARVRLYGINRKMEGLYNTLMGYKTRHKMLAKVFLCSLAVQGGVIIGYFALGRGLDIDISIGYYFLFIPLTTAVSMLPISLSGLGIREGAFVYLFAKAGVAREEAMLLSLMWFAVTAFASLAGGIEYIRSGATREGLGRDAEGLKKSL